MLEAKQVNPTVTSDANHTQTVQTTWVVVGDTTEHLSHFFLTIFEHFS